MCVLAHFASTFHFSETYSKFTKYLDTSDTLLKSFTFHVNFSKEYKMINVT